MTNDQIPSGRDVELAASTLRTEAAKLAVWRELDDDGNITPGHWEAPGGGAPVPGAVDTAYGFLRVAGTLEGLVEPLSRFAQASEAGLSPMEFLMSMMAEQNG